MNISGQGTAEKAASTHPTPRQTLLVLSVGAIACAALWLFFFIYQKDQHDIAFDRARHNTENLAIAFEQNLLGLFNGADQQLLTLKRRFERDPAGFDLERAMEDAPTLSSVSLQVGVADRDGDVTTTTGLKGQTGVNIADRRHFSVHRENDTGAPYISAPVLGRVSRKTAIQMTRRLNAPSGDFAGVIVASINPAEISSFFSQVDLGPNAVIAAVGADGVIRARASASGSISQENETFNSEAPFLHGVRSGFYVDVDPATMLDCVISFRQVGDYPLFVLVGMSTEDLLLPPGAQIRSAALVAAVGSVLIAMLCNVLLQNFARRREFEATLKAEAQRYRDFARSASEWQWETDAEGRFIWFSESTHSVTGIDPKLVLGRRREEFVLSLEEPAWVEYRAAVARHEPFQDFVSERNRVTGGRWHLRSSGVPIFTEDGTFKGYRGISSDVTRSEQAVLELRNAEAQLRALTANLPGIVHQTRRKVGGGDFAYSYLSERVIEYFGCTPEEACADPGKMHTAIHPDDMPAVKQRMASAPEVGEIRSWEYRVLVDGRQRWLRGVARFRLDERDNDWLLGDGVVIDVTELKEREQETRIAREQAEAADRAKTSFLAHVSHELRTPLNAIMGYAEVIRDRLFGAADTRYPGYAAHIYDSGAHLLSIINDLLDLTRIDAGKAELDEVELPVRTLLNDCLALIRAQAGGKGVRLFERIEVDGSLQADRRRLTQAVVNILANAVKFAPLDGEVTIVARLRSGGALAITIEDDGPGMSEEEVEHAFEPFRRGDATIRRGTEGTGLGLPICKRLMEMHGGEVVIEGQAGKGAKVTLIMPATRCRALKATKPAPPNEGAPAKGSQAK